MRRDRFLTLLTTEAERRQFRQLARGRPTDYLIWACQVAEAAHRWATSQSPDDLESLRSLAISKPGRQSFGA